LSKKNSGNPRAKTLQIKCFAKTLQATLCNEHEQLLRKNTSGNPPATNMNNYYAGCGGGCFGGDCVVTIRRRQADQDTHNMWTGSELVKSVKQGDYVQVADGSFAKVRCTVQIPRASGKKLVIMKPKYRHVETVDIQKPVPEAGSGYLVITPKHPVLMNAGAGSRRWVLPKDLVLDPTDAECSHPFSEVLQEFHVESETKSDAHFVF
jgi:hypothetical protein